MSHSERGVQGLWFAVAARVGAARATQTRAASGMRVVEVVAVRVRAAGWDGGQLGRLGAPSVARVGASVVVRRGRR